MLSDQQKTQAVISTKDTTRIAVEDDRIQQIFGCHDQFDLQSDDARGQIFIKAVNSKPSKPLFITIVTEKGLTQDLKLIPKDIEAQSILFKPEPFSASLDTNFKGGQKSYTEDVMDLMQAMFKGDVPPFYRKKKLTYTDRALTHQCTLQPIDVYEGEQLKGCYYRIVNNGTKTVTLVESSIAIPKDVAISIFKRRLLPKESTKVFIVSKREGAT